MLQQNIIILAQAGARAAAAMRRRLDDGDGLRLLENCEEDKEVS
jgi:hypothetical protein